jgi:capsular polysaccharide biosynthesis protein
MATADTESEVELRPGEVMHNPLPPGCSDEQASLFARARELVVPPLLGKVLPDTAVNIDSVLTRRGRILPLRAGADEFLALPTALGIPAKAKSLLRNVTGRQLRRLDRAVIWPLDEWGGEYYHWLTETLVKLLAVQPAFPGTPVLLPAKLLSREYVTQSLQLLPDLEIIEMADDEVVLPPKLIVPSSTCGRFHGSALSDLRDRLLRLLEIPIASPSRRLFVSRAKAERRHLTNEAAVAKLLADGGFDILYPEDCSWTEQVRLFSSASHVVGVHGAALTGTLFMPPGGNILELRLAGDTWNNCYYALANQCGQTYHFLECAANVPVVQWAKLTADTDRLADAVGRMLAGAS